MLKPASGASTWRKTDTTCIEVIRDVTARRETEAELEESRMQVLQAQKMAGKQFDPHLVDSFLDGIKELLTTERKIYIRDLDKSVTLPELSATAE
ncbi:MAG: hypothetical protein V3V54_04390 [Candidatus Brocadiales bacterium]